MTAPPLIDFDAERASFARTQKLLVSTIFPVALVLILVVAASSGGVTAVVGLLVVVILVLVVVVAIDRLRRRGLSGPASATVSSVGAVGTGADPQQVWAVIHQTLAGIPIRTSSPIDPLTVEARTGLSFGSYGERMLIRVAPGSVPGGPPTVVTAWSRPIYPLAWLDYARNQRLINRVLLAVPGAHPL